MQGTSRTQANLEPKAKNTEIKEISVLIEDSWKISFKERAVSARLLTVRSPTYSMEQIPS
jgi:hypothetical protein